MISPRREAVLALLELGGIPLFLEHLYGRMFLGWARFAGHGEHSDVLE